MIPALFSIETASLRRFRVCIGLIVLVSLLQLWQDVPRFFSDDGFIPRADLEGAARFNLHMLSGSALYQYAIVSLSLVLAALLAWGIKPRLTAVLLWVCITSLQNRNLLITEGYDLYIRVVLLWLVFLPHAESKAKENRRIASLGTFAIVLQTLVVYLVNARNKWNPQWLGGTALDAVFRYDFFPTDLGRALLSWPLLLSFLGYATLIVEALFPALLVSPFHSRLCRKIFAISLFALHLGICLTLRVEFFSAVGMAVAILFWPTGKAPEKTEVSKLPGGLSFACYALIALMLWHGVKNEGEQSTQGWPRPIDSTVQALRLHQKWKMFARPRLDFPHLVVIGYSTNRTSLQLPERVPFRFPLEEKVWKKGVLGLSKPAAMTGTSRYLESVLRYHCSEHRDMERVRAFHAFKDRTMTRLSSVECREDRVRLAARGSVSR